jgi:hypothetical protein
MSRDATRSVPASSAAMLRWILQGDTSAITCQLDVRGPRSYEVCVVPHGEPASAVIERFDGVTAALLRHAQITRRLRERGWLVIDHVAAEGIHTAA